MPNRRLTRVNELLKREIAAELYRTGDPARLDLSAITITQVDVSSNLRRARVSVSIRAPEPRQRELLEAVRDHRIALQDHLNKAVDLKYTPTLSFELDESIAEGDRILRLIEELEPDLPESDNEDETDAPFP